MTLENEDQRAARIMCVSTGLIGHGGVHIPPERLSFEPRELTLLPGTTGDVIVQVNVPASIAPGTYSGVIQVKDCHHLHGVLMVEVDTA